MGPLRQVRSVSALFDQIGERLGTAAIKWLKLGRVSVADFASGKPEAPPRNPKPALDAYQRNVWVYSGVYAIAAAAASLPIKVVRKSSDGESEEEIGHPFVKLLNNPNPFMTRLDIVELLVIFLENAGDGYLLFDDLADTGRPKNARLLLKQVKELWPIAPNMMKVAPGQNDLIDSYTYAYQGTLSSGKSIVLSRAEVAHFRYPNPLSLIYGQGSTQAVAGAINGDDWAERLNNAFFKNGGLPSALLKTEKALSKEQRAEMRQEWSRLYSGVQNAHKVAILEAGLDLAIPNQGGRKDMEFESYSLNAQKRILAALGVPPVIVGSQDAKYDNAEQQLRVFWEMTMLPKLRRMAAVLTKKLHELGEADDLEVIFDTVGVKALQVDHKTQGDIAKIWRDIGVPANELIRIFGPDGLEQFEGGDVPMIPAGFMPIEDVLSGANGTDPAASGISPEGTPEDAPPDPGAEDQPGDPKKKAAGSSDKAIDDAHWKRFIATSEPGFRRLRAELKRFFAGQRARVQAKLAEAYRAAPDSAVRAPSVELISIDLNEETKKLAKAARKSIEAIYLKMGKQAVADIGVSGIDFSIESPLARQFLDSHIFKFSFEVNKTTQARLRDALQEKIASGATQADLTEVIKEQFDFAQTWRAARIARTESGIAGNAGIYHGMKLAGVEGKRWISSRDEKVRETHKAVDGDQVPLRDPFEVGGALMMFPGDPSGPVEEIVNCRCTLRAAMTLADLEQ